MSKLIVVALAAVSACASSTSPFKPVTASAPEDAHGRIVRGILAAGYSIDTTDEAAGVVTTKWWGERSWMSGTRRYRWTIAVTSGTLTVLSQCEFEGSKNEWWTCQEQAKDRGAKAQRLANFILSQPRGEVAAKPRPAPAQPVTVPRGFFCATTTCAREKATCEQVRVSSGDATSCALVELAFCFDLQGSPVCARTAEQCGQQRAVAGSAGACAQRQ